MKGGSSIRPDDYLFNLPHNPWIHQPSEDYDGVRPRKLAAWLKKFDQQ